MKPFVFAGNVVRFARSAPRLPAMWSGAGAVFASPAERRKYFLALLKGRARFLFGISGGNEPIEFRLAENAGHGRITLRMRENNYDINLINEIFIRRVYAAPRVRNAKKILDLGANIGAAALFFASQYPDAELHCVEPVHENAELLRENLEINGINAVVHELGVGGKAGVGKIYLAKNPGCHSAIDMGKGTGKNARKFRRETLSGIALLAGGDFEIIKIDVEGAEHGLIKCGENILLSAKCIVGEVHDKILGQERAQYFKNWLEMHFDVDYMHGDLGTGFTAYRKSCGEAMREKGGRHGKIRAGEAKSAQNA